MKAWRIKAVYTLTALILVLANVVCPRRTFAITSISVKFERTGCLGPCPEYAVSISPKGELVYYGIRNVPRTGEVRAHLSQSALSALVSEIKRQHYFTLRNSYSHESD